MARNIFSVLNEYFKDISKHENSDASMRFEGLRLKSFHCVNVATSCIRLASAGFYATKNGDETKCYSCGVIHRGWRATDKPLLIHRNISPACRHIANMNTDNLQFEPRLQNFASLENPHVITDRGACSGQDVKSRNTLLTSPNRQSTQSIASIVGTLASTSDLDSVSALDCNAAALTTPDAMQNNQSNGLTARHTSPHFDKAVYPHYKELRDRLKSFATWPVNHCKKPEDLARAGFFYAGYSDCVRCFVCGVGLRTWEEEDNPWVEHVRCRSSCDFVTVVKGKDFVMQTLGDIGKENRKPINNDTPQVDIMETAECLQALEMGFDRQNVRQSAIAITSTQERLVTSEDNMASGTSYQMQTTLVPNPRPTLLPIRTHIPNPHQTAGSAVFNTDFDNGANEDELGLTDYTADHSQTEPESRTDLTGVSEGKHQDLKQTELQSPERQGAEALSQFALSKSLPQLGASKPGRESAHGTERRGGSISSYSLTTEEENRELKESSVCKVCLDEPANIVFLPCGHLVTCVTCSPALQRCPVCRKHILGTVRVYLANNASLQRDN